MAVNRLLYTGVLILCAVFYFASGSWYAWLLLALVLALPLLSLLVSLPAMLSCRLQVSAPETVEQGEQASLHLRLSAWRFLSLPEVQARLNLRTRDQDKDMRFLSRLGREEGILALPTDVCGFLSAEFHRGRVCDILGLFRLPMRLPKPVVMAILPPERRLNPMPRLEQFLQQQMKAKPGGGAAEQHDHRSYRPGDPVKAIHWKLSLKSDELVVREALEPVQRRIVLALMTPRGAAARAETLGGYRWFSHWLLDHGVPHDVIWMDGEEQCERHIGADEDWQAVLRAACVAPENTADLPWPQPIRADWVCPLGRKGGVGS